MGRDTLCHYEPSVKALHLVLMVVLAQEEACRLMESSHNHEQSSLWPSAIYDCLAQEMIDSQRSWNRATSVLEQRLSPQLRRFIDRPPRELVEAAHEGRLVWQAMDFAALLWAFVRQREPALEPMIARLSAEAEVAITKMAI